MKLMPKKSGFTLVELLVVITIIAILSVIGITIFTNVLKSARDAKKRGDVDAIFKAYEVNYQFGSTTPYQVPVPGWFVGGSIPKDPRGFEYYWNGFQNIPAAARTTYTICAFLEIPTGNSTSKGDGVTFRSEIPNNFFYCAKNAQ